MLQLLKIGEIAGLCGISIKSLRHYNKIGIFKPKYIDPSNNYRFYGEEQVQKLNFILDLKNIGLSLNEIARVINNGSDKQYLLNLLTIKKNQSEDSIRSEELKIESINSIAKTIQGKLGAEVLLSAENKEQYDEKLERLVSLDSADSTGRHAIEEAIWL